jgi:hypothetical protein
MKDRVANNPYRRESEKPPEAPIPALGVQTWGIYHSVSKLVRRIGNPR